MAVPYLTVTDPTADPNQRALLTALGQNPLDAASNGGVNPAGTSGGSILSPSIGNTTQTPKASGPSVGGFTPTGNIPGQITPTQAQAQDASNGGLGAARNPNGKGGSANNDQTFLDMLNSGQYSSPQAAIDAFNAMGLNADSTGLSSHYGSSPAYYSDGNAIGLPDAVLSQGADGKWTATARGNSGSSSSSAAAPTPAPATSSVVSPGTSGGLSPLLTNDPIASIQQSLAQFGNANPNLQALIHQLGSGQ